MAKKNVDKWTRDKHKDSGDPKRGIRGGRPKAKDRTAEPAHPSTLPKGQSVTDLRVEGDLDLSIFDDLEPNQAWVINPPDVAADDVLQAVAPTIDGQPPTWQPISPAAIAVTTDGAAPASSPSVAGNVYGSFRALDVFWTAVSNADPVIYDVYLHTATIPDNLAGATLVASGPGLNAHITRRGATLLDTGTTYYIRVVARDGDGSATPGAEGSAATLGGDTAAPGSSPTPTVLGGPRQIFAHWTGIANTDVVTYEVHISTSSGFTPGSTTKVFETQGTFAVIEKVGSGLGGGALSYSTNYYVKLIAKDVDGSASASSEAGPVTLDPNAAIDLATGSVTAAKLETLLILATTIATASGTGARVVIDSSGIRVYNSSNTLIVEFPIPGALNAVHTGPYLKGTLVADALQMSSDDSTPATSASSILWKRDATGETTGYVQNSADGGGKYSELDMWARGDTQTDDDWLALTLLGVVSNRTAEDYSHMYIMVSGKDYTFSNNPQEQSQVVIANQSGVKRTNKVMLQHQYGPSDHSLIGEVILFPSKFGPQGEPMDAYNKGDYLRCDGASYFKSQYPILGQHLAPNFQCSITIASPGVVELTNLSSGEDTLAVNDPVKFSGGTLPTGIVDGTQYYVKTIDPGSTGAKNKFTISSTVGGAAINTSGTQSGTHYCTYNPYGGDGSSFNVPDFRSRVPVGHDPAGVNTTSFKTEGSTGGETTHALTTAELATHSHTNTATFAGDALATHSHTAGSLATGNNTTTVADGNGGTLYRASGTGGLGAGSTIFARQGGSTQQLIAESHNHSVSGTTQAVSAGTPSGTVTMSNANAGSGTAHNNLQPYQVISYWIRADNSQTAYDGQGITLPTSYLYA